MPLTSKFKLLKIKYPDKHLVCAYSNTKIKVKPSISEEETKSYKFRQLYLMIKPHTLFSFSNYL